MGTSTASLVELVAKLVSNWEAEVIVQRSQAKADLLQAGFSRPSRKLAHARSTLKRSRLPGPRNFMSFERIAPGTLQGQNEDALIDTGAKNLVSESFVRDHAIEYDGSLTQLITIADGSTIPTLGSVSLPWSFQNEQTTHLVKFAVLATRFCSRAVTFGMQFMKETGTLTSFAHRVVRGNWDASFGRIFLQGSFRTRMMGYCEGQLVNAVPDTGADVPLMSLQKAKDLGLWIDTSEECQIYLELLGKQIVRTSGMVAGVDWRFGEGTSKDHHLVDFYVLEDLAVDIVLDEDLLWRTNAFQVYEDFLLEFGGDWLESEESLYLPYHQTGRTKTGFAVTNTWERVKQLSELQLWTRQRDELLDEARAIRSSSEPAQEKQAKIEEVNKRLFLLQRQRPRKDPPPTNTPAPSPAASSISMSPPPVP